MKSSIQKREDAEACARGELGCKRIPKEIASDTDGRASGHRDDIISNEIPPLLLCCECCRTPNPGSRTPDAGSAAPDLWMVRGWGGGQTYLHRCHGDSTCRRVLVASRRWFLPIRGRRRRSHASLARSALDHRCGRCADGRRIRPRRLLASCWRRTTAAAAPRHSPPTPHCGICTT